MPLLGVSQDITVMDEAGTGHFRLNTKIRLSSLIATRLLEVKLL